MVPVMRGAHVRVTSVLGNYKQPLNSHNSPHVTAKPILAVTIPAYCLPPGETFITQKRTSRAHKVELSDADSIMLLVQFSGHAL